MVRSGVGAEVRFGVSVSIGFVAQGKGECHCWYPPGSRTVVGVRREAPRLTPHSRTVPMQTLAAAPRPNLLHEQLRFALSPMCATLAAAPGTLYGIVYVGPLPGPDVLRDALQHAVAGTATRLSDWDGTRAREGTPVLLLCGQADALEASRWCAAREGVQLVVWGETPVEDLPREVRDLANGPDALVFDPRAHTGPSAEGGVIGSAVQRLVTDPRGPGNPLVLLSQERALPVVRDLAHLHLDTVGFSPADAKATGVGLDLQKGGAAVVLASTEAEAGTLADLACRCRSAGVPLVLVASQATWEHIRGDFTWSADAGEGVVVRLTGLVEPPPAADVAWPPLAAVWIGAPAASDPQDALVLPRGTTLLEALAYLEVRGRPGRVAAWAADRAAVVHVDVRTAGAAVVGVLVAGRSPAPDRAATLAQLDEIRGWPELQVAVLAAPGPTLAGEIEETVQRIGFYFARLDDERRGGAATPARPSAPGPHAAALVLIELGLGAAARRLLQEAEGASQWAVEEELLLAFLTAEVAPGEAISRLRHAALHLSTHGGRADAWVLQTDTTLNALLLMVRTGSAGAAEAWVTVEGWVRDAGTDWVSSPRQAAVLFELAARAGEARQARTFARLFREMANPDDPLAMALEPVLHTMFGGEP